MEKQLTDWGAVIVKFWLQIDKDEQLKRFNDRQSTPSKQWKITPEDWRNREKWDSYEIAVNQMLGHTSTEFAPWHVVPTQCKKYGRIQVLEHIIHAIDKNCSKLFHTIYNASQIYIKFLIVSIIIDKKVIK